MGAQPPSAEDVPPEDTAFWESLGWMRVIIFVLGGGLFLFMALLIILYFVPGREKEPNSIADQAASNVATGEGNRIESQPRSAGSAIYDVEIDPPSATLAIQNNMGTITGTGRTRQIRFDNIPSRSYVNITASCRGL